jgi:hypothetical protein
MLVQQRARAWCTNRVATFSGSGNGQARRGRDGRLRSGLLCAERSQERRRRRHRDRFPFVTRDLSGAHA